MKKRRKLFIILPVVLVLLASAVLIYYFGATYPEYEQTKQVEFSIPGLNEKFIPQGFNYDEETDTYLISGYMADYSASRIYRVKGDTKSDLGYVNLKVGETLHKGHMGGITSFGNNVWVASSGKVYRANKTEILLGESGSSVSAIDNFDPNNNSSFITAFEGKLWVGEFYRSGNYETDESHYLKIDDNVTNKALAFCFDIDESAEFGIASTTPTMALSLPNQIQGFAFTSDGKVITSSSYSIPDSQIAVYKDVFTSDYLTQMTVNGNTLPVYVLKKENLVKNITAPAMSEEIVVKNNRIFILYESACSKYKLINRTRKTSVESISIAD